MIKKMTLFLIILVSIVLICNQETKAGQIVKSYKTSKPPLIDGMATEDIWKNVPTVKTFDPIAQVEIELKSVHNDSMIFSLSPSQTETNPDNTETGFGTMIHKYTLRAPKGRMFSYSSGSWTRPQRT